MPSRIKYHDWLSLAFLRAIDHQQRWTVLLSVSPQICSLGLIARLLNIPKEEQPHHTPKEQHIGLLKKDVDSMSLGIKNLIEAVIHRYTYSTSHQDADTEPCENWPAMLCWRWTLNKPEATRQEMEVTSKCFWTCAATEMPNLRVNLCWKVRFSHYGLVVLTAHLFWCKVLGHWPALFLCYSAASLFSRFQWLCFKLIARKHLGDMDRHSLSLMNSFV